MVVSPRFHTVRAWVDLIGTDAHHAGDPQSLTDLAAMMAVYADARGYIAVGRGELLRMTSLDDDTLDQHLATLERRGRFRNTSTTWKKLAVRGHLLGSAT